MTEAHLQNLLSTLRNAARVLNVGETGNLASGVLDAAKAMRDLWNERDEADRRAGAAERKLLKLQRQIDRMHARSNRRRRPSTIF